MGEYDLHIGIYGEENNFTSTMNKVRNEVRRTASEVEKGGLTIEQTFDRIKKAATYSLMGFSAAGFIKQVGQVRGEFQKLEVAFNTMLGNVPAITQVFVRIRCCMDGKNAATAFCLLACKPKSFHVRVEGK